jgi:protein gp37
MAENSKIEWCDHTVNLWWGCAKVHTGCKNCYAEYYSDTRYKKNLWSHHAKRLRIKSAFASLDKYQKKAEEQNVLYKIFCGSMMDIFEFPMVLENPTDEFKTTGCLRNKLFIDIEKGKYKNLIFLFLTKRPDAIFRYISTPWFFRFPKNVWFGTSISDQETANVYIEKLAEYKDFQYNLFLSIEPQVGDIWKLDLDHIKWVIQGGESGHKRRPFELQWAYDMKRMCKEAGVPYFFKQIDKIQAIPKDLEVREFPEFEIGETINLNPCKK